MRAAPATVNASSAHRPLIVGLGGTAAPHSTSERVLRIALELCEGLGARTEIIPGQALDFHTYGNGQGPDPRAAGMLDAIRRADGIIIASPGYHGCLSGLIKNALDHVEELARDTRPYFEGRALGLIGVAAGWQAAGSTLAALRAITHALRGWPTPKGVLVNSADKPFDDAGTLSDQRVHAQLALMASEVMFFAQAIAAGASADRPTRF